MLGLELLAIVLGAPVDLLLHRTDHFQLGNLVDQSLILLAGWRRRLTGLGWLGFFVFIVLPGFFQVFDHFLQITNDVILDPHGLVAGIGPLQPFAHQNHVIAHLPEDFGKSHRRPLRLNEADRIISFADDLLLLVEQFKSLLFVGAFGTGIGPFAHGLAQLHRGCPHFHLHPQHLHAAPLQLCQHPFNFFLTELFQQIFQALLRLFQLFQSLFLILGGTWVVLFFNLLFGLFLILNTLLNPLAGLLFLLGII